VRGDGSGADTNSFQVNENTGTCTELFCTGLLVRMCQLTG